METTDALDAVRAQRDALIDQGVSTFAFAVGVANMILTAFVLGRWPQHYWVFHAAKGLVYYPLRVLRQVKQKALFDLLEICWIANALIILFLLLAAANEIVDEEFITMEQLRAGFLIIFTMGAGPLGYSVAAFGNALIFHSVDHMASLFIHAGPFLTCWGLLDAAPDAISASYPRLGEMLADVRARPPDVAELLGPAATAYMCWWIPYTAFIVLTLHPDSLFVRSFEGSVSKLLKGVTKSRQLAATAYCLGHLAGFFFAFLTPLVTFHSRAALTVWCVGVLGVALFNGAARYRYYLVEAYEKKLRKAVGESESQAKGKEMV